ncbi:hypothetical protein GQ457_17G025330 [Hibiscus cannabinus]
MASKTHCAYAVASTGKRCVLEKHVKRGGEEEYTCRTSEIEADKIRNWIETDDALKPAASTGTHSASRRIRSSSLASRKCSVRLNATTAAPNIIDLYFNLAAGEGVFLPKLCEVKQGNVRRGMSEIRSSGLVAPGPIGSVKFMEVAPAMPPY